MNEGEIVGVIGPNGAGKSTMLMATSAAIPVAEGDIRFEGTTVLKQRPEDVVGRGISLVPEGRHIFKRCLSARTSVSARRAEKTPRP